jgi:RNA polymerase sigma-70 factor (ECF subfamily)
MRNNLFKSARRLTNSHADAEDLVQETLLYAFTGFRTFAPGTNVNAWLSRIMRNRWITEYRRCQRRPIEDLAGDIGSRVLAASKTPQSAAIRQSVEEDVLAILPDGDLAAAFATLPASTRLVMYYAEIEGYRLQEVADLLGIPIGTVMSRLYRGRRRMRDRLGDLPSEPHQTSRPQR